MSLREDIYRNFNSKSTDELISILNSNNNEEFTELAFEVISEILQTREPESLTLESSDSLPKEKKLVSETEHKTKSSFETYPALYTISSLMKLLAYFILLLAIGSLIIGIVSYSENESIFSIVLIISSVFYGFIGFVLLLALSELIKLFIDIEKNTRKYRKD